MIKIKTDLCCGCCGLPFFTWRGYTDQDQDQDYGICRECQNYEEKTEEEYEEIYQRILTKAKPGGKERAMTRNEEDPNYKYWLVNFCLETGRISVNDIKEKDGYVFKDKV